MIMLPPRGSSASFLAKASCFVRPVTHTSWCCNPLFCIEQSYSFLPHFIFTSIPWLSSRPPSSETTFQNFFCNFVVEHPCNTYSPLSSFNGQTDYCFPQFCLVRFTVTFHFWTTISSTCLNSLSPPMTIQTVSSTTTVPVIMTIHKLYSTRVGY